MTPAKPSLASQTAVLVVRLWVGLNFALNHGLKKIQDPDTFLESIEMRAFPSYRELGWVAIGVHFIGGLLVTIGLQTRAAAAALCLSMLGAAYVAHADDIWSKREFPLTYGVLMLFLALHGGGPVSVDAWLDKRRRKMSPW